MAGLLSTSPWRILSPVVTPPRKYASRLGLARAHLLTPVRRACVLGVRLSAGALVLFHVYIFWKQFAAGDLADPAKGLAWGVGAALFACMIALRQAGVPLLRGRRALAVWLMVAVLHVGVINSAPPPADAAAAAANAALALFTVPSSLLSVALLSGLLLLLTKMRRRPSAPRLSAGYARRSRARALAHLALRVPLPSRAPPVPVW